jgi:hypothetical protein
MADKRIDVSQLSEKELQQVHNEVLQTLATRVRAGGVGPIADYDRHSSGHSRSGGGIAFGHPQEVLPAEVARVAPKTRRTT